MHTEHKFGFDDGEDQVALICRHTPANNDAEVATLARSATVAQLHRTLSRYGFVEPEGFDGAEAEPSEPREAPQRPAVEVPEARRVSFGFTEAGWWRLSALLPPDQGVLVERALAAARHRLVHGQGDTEDAPKMVSWADALVTVAEGYLAGEGGTRPHHDRHLVLVHVSTGDDGTVGGHLHLGPALPDALRRYLGCDARARLVVERAGVALSVGRAHHIVAERTRTAVEDRDGGCRVPGCERNRWLQIHHIRHWEDAGPTDTENLLALCSAHHRAHHRGLLGITGNADDPHGVVFTNSRGRPLAPCGRPRRPTELVSAWVHPTGERFDPKWVHFHPPPPANEQPPPRPTDPATVTFDDDEGELITVG